MSTGTHRIQCLSIKADEDSAENALRLRKQLNEHWQELLPVFEQSFDAVSANGERLHISKLYLNIQVPDNKKLTGILPDLLRKTLQEQLKKYSSPVAIKQESLDFSDDHVTTQSSKNEVLSDLDILWVYLKTGRLPWHVKTEADWNPKFEKLALDNLPLLLPKIVASEEVFQCFRLLTLLPEFKLKNIVEVMFDMTARKNEQYRRYYSALIRLLINDRLSITGTHQKLWLISGLLIKSVMDGSGGIFSIHNLIPSAQLLSENQVTSWLKNKAFRNPQNDYLRHNIIHDISRFEIKIESDGLPASKVINTKQKGELKLEDKLKKDLSVGQQEAISERVYLAGLILLHPYIPLYLKSCGISTSGKDIPDQQCEKAAALLVYLVKGSEKVAEYELDLVKLMLGLPVDYPLPLAEGLLGEKSKQEAERLLKSFVTHWSALKNTSIEGVRNSFLQRSGLLKKRQQDWLLKIDRTGIDILLDQLPFSYSLVKFPWMLKLITIEW